MDEKVESASIKIDTIADALQVGVLLINDCENVVYANSAAEKLFGNRLSSSKTYRCGDFVSCVNKNKSPEGCGYSLKCQECSLLKAIQSILNGNLEQDEKGEIKITTSPDCGKIWVKYTAKELIIDEKKYVLLSIDDISKLKLVEENLRKGEERYRSLANSGHAMVWTSKLDMECDFFNQPWLSFTGRDLNQELGRGWLENVHPEDRQQCMDTYSQSFENKISFSMCYRVKRYDGEYRWLEDFGSPMYDANGRFTGYIGHCFDITDRLDTERRLDDSLDFSRNIFNSSESNIAIIDKNWIIVEHNHAWSKFALDNNAAGQELWGIGVSYRQEVCQDSKDFEIAQEAFAGIQTVLDGKQNFFQMDYPCPPSSEDDRWFSMRAFPMKGELGQVIISHTDITERKLAEIASKRSEQKYKDLVNTLPYGIEEIDLNGCMVFLNDAYHKMLGYRSGELIGTNIWDYGPTKEAKEKLKEYFEKIKKEKPIPETYISKNLRKDGSVIDVHVNWDYSYDEDGQLKGFIAVVTDITDRIKSDQTLRDSEIQYRMLVNNIPDYVMRYDRKHRHIFGNDKAIQSAGKTKQTYIGKTHREMGFPENLCTLWEKAIDHVFDTNSPQTEIFEWQSTTDTHILEWRVIVDWRDAIPTKCQAIIPVRDRGRPGSLHYQA